ncbi:MAG: hypothetical protein KBF65_05895 [Rubrivivax sp.]|nr:hypothetical protein [Betaproteobacteria bacterium]MBP6320300.1 hypothetical protein [Rubrivivax sp.]MBK7275415.1 hypothetical protein [Betaproteobacteria bacterium]MBK7459003.1 hypothetical protein [Betaproteobacteria bacterium]MBK7514601.1 hypothetical protein [Betaproteobacteria bacterium]
MTLPGAAAGRCGTLRAGSPSSPGAAPLLLHDRGPGRAGTLAEAKASGAAWRTPPRWSIGLTTGVVGGRLAWSPGWTEPRQPGINAPPAPSARGRASGRGSSDSAASNPRA